MRTPASRGLRLTSSISAVHWVAATPWNRWPSSLAATLRNCTPSYGSLDWRRPASIDHDLCTSPDMTPKRAAIYAACIAAAFIVLLLVSYRETLWGLWIWLWT